MIVLGVIRVFTSDLIGQQLGKFELEQLATDFKRYKETGIPAACFGRDVPYDHPLTLPAVRSEDLMHLRLAEGAQHWANRQTQYNRTSDYPLDIAEDFTRPTIFY